MMQPLNISFPGYRFRWADIATQNSKILFIVFLLTILLTAGSACFPKANPGLGVEELTVWAVSGMKRIGLNDQPGERSQIELYAARGEYEPFQIGVRASKSSLTNVKVLFSDLTNSSGQMIEKANITLYREHYVNVPHASPRRKGAINHSLGPGWYADALIPFLDPETRTDIVDAQFDAVPFDVKAETNQPIWVDIFVPRNVRPGEYKGTYDVVSDQATFRGEIILKVWDFELPLKPSINSAFALWESENTISTIELLKHRLMPEANDISSPLDERKLIDIWGLTSLRLPFWSGANVSSNQIDPPPPVSRFKAEAAKHEPDLFLYVRYADEIDRFPNLFETAKSWSRNIHVAGLSTAMAVTPTPELYDDGSNTGRSAVDIWVVLPEMYDSASERVVEVLEKGDQVWYYTALVQDGYSPKWQIDYAPINFRIPHGWICQNLGLTGILYWQVDWWTNDPWSDVTHVLDDEAYPGEGMLVYPGQEVGVRGVVPSIRLKWIREGIEDYEYIDLLKRLDPNNPALEIVREIGPDWKDWTRDIDDLEAARKSLGHELNKLSSQLA